MSFSAVTSPDVFVGSQPSGSACCVWRDGLSRTYLLSAAHVVGDLPPATPVSWVGTDAALGNGVTLEPALYWIPVAGGELDAGLVAINTPGPFASSTAYPWATPLMSWEGVDSVRSVIVCGKHGQRFATFAGKLPAGEPLNGRRYGRLLRFRFDSVSTLPGDSGGPVISLPEGMLIGMHIARRNEAGAQYSLAVSAADIVDTYGWHFPGFALRP